MSGWSDRDTSDEVERLLPEVSVEDAAEFSAHLRMGLLREALAAVPRPCHFRRCLLTIWHEGAHEVDREVDG